MWEETLADITDSINIKIINLLMEDGRISDQFVANKTGVSKTFWSVLYSDSFQVQGTRN
jgi:hypothetical protein